MDSVRARHLAAEVAGKTLNGWTVGDLIDNGKSAAVFHARNASGVKGAIKIFDRELVEKQGKESQLQRIEREKELVGKCHPNLIKILDGGYSDEADYCYVVMDFLPGKTLSDVVPTFPRDAIFPIISQIASAAQFLEQLGLTHRDIKPENIRILDDMTPVLLDLGVLRPLKESNLTDGEEDNRFFLGTLQYSSPEFLLRDEDGTTECWRAITFYQIGAVLHDLVMRRPIFNKVSPYAKMVNAVQHTMPVISATDVSKEIILLAKKCLLKDWTKRLECVDWSDFSHKINGPSLGDIKDKIFKNRIAAKALISGITQDHEIQTQNKRKLDEIAESILKVIRKIRNQNKDVLPALQAGLLPSCTDNGKDIIVTFERSESYGLAKCLSVFVHIRLLDATEKAVDIRVGGKVSEVKETTPPCDCCDLIKKAYGGIYDSNHIESILSPIFLVIFEKAQETALAIASGDSLLSASPEFIDWEVSK